MLEQGMTRLKRDDWDAYGGTAGNGVAAMTAVGSRYGRECRRGMGDSACGGTTRMHEGDDCIGGVRRWRGYNSEGGSGGLGIFFRREICAVVCDPLDKRQIWLCIMVRRSNG